MILVGMRPDFIQGNFGVFKWVFSKLSMDYRAKKEEDFVFKKNCYFLFFQEKVSSSDFYQCMHLTVVLLTRLQNHRHLQG